MIVTQTGVFSLLQNEHALEVSPYVVYWAGAVISPGETLGAASIRRFVETVRAKGIAEARDSLVGNFFILVHDKNKRTWQTFTDRNGVFQAYKSDTAISTSFLDLIDHEHVSHNDLDREATVEFLNTGYIYRGRTFFPSICRLDHRGVSSFSPEGSVTVSHVNDLGIEKEPREAGVAEFFEKIAPSLRGVRVSVDLTGGIDSRLVATLLDYFGVAFETAISGWNADLPDIVIGREIARVLGREIFVTLHTLDDVERVGDTLFVLSDGLCDAFDLHRLFHLSRERSARGIGLTISGLGGELYKEFYWLQDFPFYSRKRANLGRLFDLRFLPIRCPDGYFTEDYAQANRSLRQTILQDLRRYTLASNTQTYDNIYFEVKAKTVAGRSITTSSHLIPAYAPLLELDLVRHGFRLPRSQRFFDRWHRNLITRLNPVVAGIRTAQNGMTVSSRSSAMAVDVLKYAADKSKRLVKKLSQRLCGRTILMEGPDHPDLWSRVRGLSLAGACIERLVEERILRPGVSLGDVSDRYLGKLIVLAEVLNRLDGGGHKA